MALTRYLLYMSYLGKSFLGAQRQVKRKFVDMNTVQGCLELALKELNPDNEPTIYLSSRTDSGVHAICSTCTVDLYRENSLVYQPKTLTLCLNKFFNKEEIPIRILRTYQVPETFNCRWNAISRTYMYRIGVNQCENPNINTHYHHFPMEECERCFFICSEQFDIDHMKEACKLFVGLHDFRTFMKKSAKEPEKMTRRTVRKLDVLECESFTYSPYSWPECIPNSCDDYRFYNIQITANGYLYRQVGDNYLNLPHLPPLRKCL